MSTHRSTDPWRENGWKQVNNRNYQLGTYEKRIEE